MAAGGAERRDAAARPLDRVRRLQRTASFRLKLFGVLLAVIAVGVSVVFVLADRAVDRNFRTLSLELGTAHAREVKGLFEAYYGQHGSLVASRGCCGDPANTMAVSTGWSSPTQNGE